MKRFLLTLSVAAMTLTGVSAKADVSLAEKIALYIPNRIVDVFDIFSINLSAGPTVRAELMLTQYAAFGGGISTQNIWLLKDYARQYGIASKGGWYYTIGFWGEERFERVSEYGFAKPYWANRIGFPDINDEKFRFYDGPRDMWQIGGALGLLVEAEVYIHPTEIADFITGIFLFDLKGDDLTFDDFR